NKYCNIKCSKVAHTVCQY
nr:antigen 5 {N-terminal} [Polybia scutellaris=camoati wasps, ssp. rioplatensis, venom, Peptide Partial, 18 aa] [Polybia scutellaris]